MLFDLWSPIHTGGQPVMAPVDGSRLTRIGEGAWVADRELVTGRSRTPLRMVVLLTGPRELLLYSPVLLDPGTREALSGLGRVCRIVVPNRFHTRFVAGTMDAYPEADLLLPSHNDGLARRFPRNSHVLPAPLSLSPGVELMPVRLRDDVDELVVYHDPSELLVLGDLLFEPRPPIPTLPPIIRLAASWRLKLRASLHGALLLRDSASLGAFYRWAMTRPFSTISVTRGTLVDRDAREVFYQRFRRYRLQQPAAGVLRRWPPTSSLR